MTVHLLIIYFFVSQVEAELLTWTLILPFFYLFFFGRRKFELGIWDFDKLFLIYEINLFTIMQTI